MLYQLYVNELIMNLKNYLITEPEAILSADISIPPVQISHLISASVKFSYWS